MCPSFKTILIHAVVLLELTREAHSDNSKIQHGLLASQTHKKFPVVVTFGNAEELEGIAYQLSEKYAYSPREDRIYGLYQAYDSYSQKCQADAVSYLDSEGYHYKKMWSTNTVAIKNADHHCVHKLAKMEDVTLIAGDEERPLIDPINDAFLTFAETQKATPTFKNGLTWGLSKMYVPEAWKYATYKNGEFKTGHGVVVGHIDTGVRVTHEAVRDNFREYDGWADGYHKSSTPEDLNGHGTHTIGTVVGNYRIGVAPGAQYISCRGCFQRECRDSALLFCCEWMICPYNTTTHPDGPPSYKNCYSPDLVTNSWGGGQGDKTYDRCIYALQAAGIIPIWAIGNAGPDAQTANSPGDNKYVIGVCATDQNDELAKFSSRGAAVDGHLKPEVCGPGVGVKSAWIDNDESYKSISGTSMATPHVAGVVALMLERCPYLPYPIVLDILQITADREFLGQTDVKLNDTRSDVFPNNYYGWGRVNALEAVETGSA